MGLSVLNGLRNHVDQVIDYYGVFNNCDDLQGANVAIVI